MLLLLSLLLLVCYEASLMLSSRTSAALLLILTSEWKRDAHFDKQVPMRQATGRHSALTFLVWLGWSRRQKWPMVVRPSRRVRG